MGKITNKISNWIIMMKIYFVRSQSYLSIISASMILFLTLSDLKDKGYINTDLSQYFMATVIIGFITLVLMGYLELKYFGGLHKEQQRYSELNPFLMDLKTKIDYLYNKETNNAK